MDKPSKKDLEEASTSQLQPKKVPASISKVVEIDRLAQESCDHAIVQEQKEKYVDSLNSYKKCIDHYFNLIRLTKDSKTFENIRLKIIDMSRCAQSVRNKQLAKDNKKIPRLFIPKDSKYFSYLTVFQPFLNNSITLVAIDESYARSEKQLNNISDFVDIIIEHCPSVEVIRLETNRCPVEEHPEYVRYRIDAIRDTLAKHNIQLIVVVNQHAHDRDILLLDKDGKGFSVAIGRGLDYYETRDVDHNQRLCRQTTVTVKSLG